MKSHAAEIGPKPIVFRITVIIMGSIRQLSLSPSRCNPYIVSTHSGASISHRDQQQVSLAEWIFHLEEFESNIVD
jgi:hypothetical protein